jgi:mannose-1-phosphate guanylyltransferase
MQTLGKPQLDLSTEVIPHYLGKIFTYENTTYHRDIGTMDSWTEANQDFPQNLGW